jgi:carbon starvation protein
MRKLVPVLMWLVVAVLGAWSCMVLALHRGEHINSAYILVAALCSYAIGYRFYSKWIAARVLMLDDRRATPCEVHDDGKDFVKTNKWIVFGHHFAAISGPGPLVGPVLAAQFGYLPGTLWILIGVVLGGAVQDMIILFASMRRDGKSLAQMVREELNTAAGAVGVIAILSIMTILLAVLALVVVRALAESPWGVFTVGSTIPIALLMGIYLRFWRVGKVLEISALGVVLLLLAVWGGQYVYADKEGLSKLFSLRAEPLAWVILVYGLAASVLPVWLLLAPRDYLSTFMKLGTIFILVMGVFMVLPDLKMPAVSKFTDGSGLVVAGKVFPFCFITIACGSISGFHTLISSGVTPKIITRESYARPIGYGAMCLESLVAIMAMVAACTLEPGVYLSMNVQGAGATADAVAIDTRAKVEKSGFSLPVRQADGRLVDEPIKVSAETMDQLALQVGEKTLYGRTGGAATLAVGMTYILSKFTHGRWLDLWYHFAIMFEALFILTTLDAGTRVGRYLLQDVLGRLWRPLGDTKNVGANFLASLLVVVSWGYFLIIGVRDPEGGVKALWPIFGIANQMLAAIALCLATTILLKMQLAPGNRAEAPSAPSPRLRHPAIALVTLVPLVWLIAVTMTAGVQKVLHPSPKIGFFAAASALEQAHAGLQTQATAAVASGNTEAISLARKALHGNEIMQFNNRLDGVITAAFIVLVLFIGLLSVREWVLLLARQRLAVLHETPPVWLPEYALAAEKPMNVLGLMALFIALARELSGEASLDRWQQQSQVMAMDQSHQTADQPTLACSCHPGKPAGRANAYVRMTEKRYRGINRCC